MPTAPASFCARDVGRALEAMAPLDSGISGDELGFLLGDPEREVNGVACMWTVQTHSLRAAVERGLNLVICHEGLWLPAQTSPWYRGPAAAEIASNRLRRELLERHRLIVYRGHSNWDALPTDGVPDQAVAALAMPDLREIARERFFSVHELPAAIPMTALRRHVSNGLGYAECRLFGDPDRKIRRFAFLIGGFGENQWHMPQAARDLGAEAIVLGEMSEFIVIACLEMGLSVVETTHSVSEIPAIRRQAQLLAQRLPGLRVEYVASGALMR